MVSCQVTARLRGVAEDSIVLWKVLIHILAETARLKPNDETTFKKKTRSGRSPPNLAGAGRHFGFAEGAHDISIVLQKRSHHAVDVQKYRRHQLRLECADLRYSQTPLVRHL